MIEVVFYDPEWPREFEKERDRLKAAFGDVAVRIEHNGSTSVPGLSAKPIIDIQISVNHLQPMNRYARALHACGYIHVRHSDDDRCPFFHRPAEWPHTHHVHVVETGSREEQQTLLFRDYLRSHPDAARRYESLKRDLACEYGGNEPPRARRMRTPRRRSLRKFSTAPCSNWRPPPATRLLVLRLPGVVTCRIDEVNSSADRSV